MDKVITVCLLAGVQVAAMAYWYYKGYSDGLADVFTACLACVAVFACVRFWYYMGFRDGLSKAREIFDQCFKERSER